MLGYNNVRFRGLKLYKGNEYTGYSIQEIDPHIKGYELYYVRWPEGELSEDYYDITWAKENCKKVYLEAQNIDLGGTTDAFK